MANSWTPHDREPQFEKLLSFLRRIPPTETGAIGSGFDDTIWWVKFSIDIEHPLAWNAVQELGHVLNYISLGEKLPTVFKPVSPPPYLNGGPEFLNWVIECPVKEMDPDTVADWLEGRLPRPVDDLSQWHMER